MQPLPSRRKVPKLPLRSPPRLSILPPGINLPNKGLCIDAIDTSFSEVAKFQSALRQRHRAPRWPSHHRSHVRLPKLWLNETVHTTIFLGMINLTNLFLFADRTKPYQFPVDSLTQIVYPYLDDSSARPFRVADPESRCRYSQSIPAS